MDGRATTGSCARATCCRAQQARRGLAAEPMTAAPNAFVTGRGLRRLEPGETAYNDLGRLPVVAGQPPRSLSAIRRRQRQLDAAGDGARRRRATRALAQDRLAELQRGRGLRVGPVKPADGRLGVGRRDRHPVVGHATLECRERRRADRCGPTAEPRPRAAGWRTPHAQRTCSGPALPNPPKPPPPPGPRLAPGGRLKPPGGRLKLPDGRALRENDGTVTPCCCKARRVGREIRSVPAAWSAAACGGTRGHARRRTDRRTRSRGGRRRAGAVFELPPPQAATSTATPTRSCCQRRASCVTRRTRISCSPPTPTRSELLRRRARRDRQSHRHRKPPPRLHSPIGPRRHRPRIALL